MKRICFSASNGCDVVSLLTRLFGGGVCGTRGNGQSSFPFKEELAIVQYTESVFRCQTLQILPQPQKSPHQRSHHS